MRRRINEKYKGEKIMRERKIVVAAFVMVALLVAGCGKSEDLTGKWVYTSMA